LQVTNSPSVNALKQLHGAAGEDFSVTCGLSFSETWKIFCRESCEGGNILIQTREKEAQRERYSIKHVKNHLSDVYILFVNISKLSESDSGLYRCGLGDSLSSVTYQDFRLVVVGKASGSSTSRSNPVHLTSPTAATLSLNYLATSASSETTDQSLLTEDRTTTKCRSSDCSPSPTSAEVWLFVAPALAIVVLFSVTLVFCRRRLKKAQTASPVELEQTPASETIRINEDVREEDEPWRSADVEIYLAYIDAMSNTVTTPIYQNKAPDDDAEVNLNSPLRAGRDNMKDDSGPEHHCHDDWLYSNLY
ncbi:hypothetical protein ILYODFUR_021736, partial [Ilyodon furcidens]